MSKVDSSDPTVKISLPWKWRPLKRRMLPGCELFIDGDSAMHLARKLIPLEDDSSSKDDIDKIMKEEIPCCAVGCKQTFTSLLSYENHYSSAHRHSCLTCHRTFPSAFLLDIHIQENHDPLFSILAARQDMYRCLVESCSERFSDHRQRRQHLIKDHSYPSTFRFHRLHSDKSSGRRKPQTDTTTASSMEVDKPSTHTETNPQSPSPPSPAPQPPLPQSESTSDKENMAAVAMETMQETEGKGEGMEVSGTTSTAPRRVFVHRVPQNFSFGHGVSRGFQRPAGKKKKGKKGDHWHQRGIDSARDTTTNIENVDMADMADALSEAV